MTGKPSHVVVMGVSGSGKSTVGALLAGRIAAEFIDGDSLHPAANVAKMSAGTPLNDEDRQPWLETIGSRFAASTSSLVIACSALKRRYRDIIRAADAGVTFVHLEGSAEVLGERMAGRPGHFMPPALLQSQLDTLEPLESDEDGCTLDVAKEPEELVAEATAWLADTHEADPPAGA